MPSVKDLRESDALYRVTEKYFSEKFRNSVGKWIAKIILGGVFPQIYIVKATCVTTKKARNDGCLPAPAPVGRRKIMITNDRGTMII